MGVYIVGPYTGDGSHSLPYRSLASAAYDVPDRSDVTKRLMSSGIPSKNLCVIFGSPSAQTVAQIHADERFFVIGEGTSSQLMSWLVGNGATVPGLSSGDSEGRARSVVAEYCRNLPAQSVPAILYGDGVSGDFWSFSDSVDSLGATVFSDGAQIDGIASGRGTADTVYTTSDGRVGDGAGTTYPLLWSSSGLYSPSPSFWTASVATDPASSDYFAGASFQFTGIATKSTIDFFWLNQGTSVWYGAHGDPGIQSIIGTGRVRINATDNAADEVQTVPLNDGLPHSVCWSVISGVIAVYVDGVQVSSFTPSGTPLPGANVSASCGDRAGIYHRFLRAIVICDAIGASEATQAHQWLVG